MNPEEGNFFGVLFFFAFAQASSEGRFYFRSAPYPGSPRCFNSERGNLSSAYFFSISEACLASVDSFGRLSCWSPRVSDAPRNAFGAAFNAYLADELGFHGEKPYHLLTSVDWSSSKADYLNNFGILRTDLDENPHLKILITGGRYDLVTPYDATKFGLNHLHLDPSERSAIELDLFPSGHMVYIDKASRLLLKADFDRWMDGLKI